MSYYDDQEEAWFDGGKEWYETENEPMDGIPGDFDPYVFWAETLDPNQKTKWTHKPIF